MKSNKGITLTSLIVYVIGMTIMVATIATLTSFFYKNIDVEDLNSDTNQYTKFTSVLSKEINRKDNSIIDCKQLKDDNDDNDDIIVSYIIFSSGNQFTFNRESHSIYKNNVKICDNVDMCVFSYEYTDSKYKIKVSLKTTNIDKTGENAIEYIL